MNYLRSLIPIAIKHLLANALRKSFNRNTHYCFRPSPQALNSELVILLQYFKSIPGNLQQANFNITLSPLTIFTLPYN